MADCAIAAPMNLDFIKAIADSPAGEQMPDKGAFASAVVLDMPEAEQLLSNAMVENPHQLIIKNVSESKEVKVNFKVAPELKNVIRLDGKESDLPAEIKALEIDSLVELVERVIEADPKIGLVESETPTAPVLKMLSKELPAEDMKLYAPVHEKTPVKSEEVQVAKADKVTFTPAQQVEVKAEQAPKFTEIVQSLPIKEEIVRAVIQKSDTSSHTDAVVQNIKTDEVAKPAAPELLSKPQVIVPEKIEEKPQLKALPSIENEARVESPKIVDKEVMSQPQQVVEVQPIKSTSVPVVPAHIQAKAPQVMQDVAVHMKQAFDHNLDKVTVQLNPPSLGKIEIELQFAKDGRVNAILMADKVETYDLLQRNPQLLKESLAGSGISPDTTDLSFNFRGHEGQSDQKNSEGQASGSRKGTSETASENISYRQAPHMNSNKKVDINA